MAPLDRLAPRRIVVDPDLCERCGVCTSVCTSHVRVHEEVHDFGAVVDQNCMKCGDCIEACPQEALQFGWATPPAFRSDASPANTKLFSMSRRMEATILAVWAVAFFGCQAVGGVWGGFCTFDWSNTYQKTLTVCVCVCVK